MCCCRICCTYRLGLAALGRVNLEVDVGARVVTADNLCVELELNALLLEELLGGLGNLSIHTRATNLAEELDDGDLGTETGPDRGHLKTNDTTTNDNHRLGDLLEGEGASAGDDALLIDVEAGERGGFGAGGDEDVLAAESGLATVIESNLDLVLIDERASTLDVLGAVLLEEELDTLGEAGDGGVLGLHEVGKVELDIANLNTSVLGVVEDLVVQMGVVKERFRGNAADVEAGSAEGSALLDTGDLGGC